MFDRHLSRHLAPYLDGKLPADRRRWADEHLAQCERCRAELDEVRLGTEIVGQLPLVEAPEAVWRSIVRELDGVEHRAASPFRLWRFAAAMAVVLVAAGISYARIPPPTGGRLRVCPARPWLARGESPERPVLVRASGSRRTAHRARGSRWVSSDRWTWTRTHGCGS